MDSKFQVATGPGYSAYMFLEKPTGSHTHKKNIFRIWRSCNHKIRMNLDGNKLVNVRRDIMNKKRLTDFELREIKEKVIADVKDTGRFWKCRCCR